MKNTVKNNYFYLDGAKNRKSLQYRLKILDIEI